MVAMHEGRGKLNSGLSVTTTADAEGKYELAGLTAGKYTLQAALDDIWVSKPVALEVGEESPGDVALAIGAPGTAVVIHVMDAAGKPVVGKELVIDRPAGPLGEALWPDVWTSDGAGTVTVPTLAAGKHMVRVKGAQEGKEIVVPAGTGKEVSVELVSE